ncbi:hypothetical protein FS842_001229 [Serendipita sp. 407]|nr:hypothetical protein FS842_001229 [Serendipita sp. 407]
MTSAIGSSFTPLGAFTVSADARLVPGACNPEKDLVLLIHHTDPRSTISLWKLQGTKRWEIDAVANFDQTGWLRQVAWSPDGEKFALGHSARRITVHSLADGCEEFRYNGAASGDGVKATWKIATLSWLKMPWRHFWDSEISSHPPPQIYPREYDSPGASLYLFKQIAKLDPKEPVIEKSAPTEVSSAHKAPRYMTPSEANGWPSLPPNPVIASIATTDIDPSDAVHSIDSNERWQLAQSNTCLFAGDNHGGLYPFIHGTFLAGTIDSESTFSQLRSIASAESCTYFSKLSFQPESPLLSFHSIAGKMYQKATGDGYLMDPDYEIQDILRISTVARDLALYAARNCDEVMIAWMGGGGREGAREQNEKWCRLLENIQNRANPQKVKDVKRDLVALLFTGVPLSMSLVDHIQNGSQTTERNFKKWHGVVTDALAHIKHTIDLAILSLQRLIALLWDLYGLATIKSTSTYFMLDKERINRCIEAASATIEILSSMSEIVRRETRGFSHFMIWLRSIIPNLQKSDFLSKTYDIVLVHAYITNGLFPSGLDSFFQPPRISLPVVAKNNPSLSIRQLATNARKALQQMQEERENGTTTYSIQQTHGQGQGRRNIIMAMNAIVSMCNFMFQSIASAITAVHQKDANGANIDRAGDVGLLASNPRSWKRILLPPGIKKAIFHEETIQLNQLQDIILRETLVPNEKGALQYVMLRLPFVDKERHTKDTFDKPRNHQKLLILRLAHDNHPPKTQAVGVAMLDLMLSSLAEPMEETKEEVERNSPSNSVDANLLDAQFYDSTCLAIVLQTIEAESRRCLALVDFSALKYHPLECPDEIIDIEKQVLVQFDRKELLSQSVTFFRSRALPSFKGSDTITLTMSSKRGVAVILDHQRWLVQSFDLNSDEEGDEAGDDQTRLQQESQTSLDEEESSMVL